LEKADQGIWPSPPPPPPLRGRLWMLDLPVALALPAA